MAQVKAIHKKYDYIEIYHFSFEMVITMFRVTAIINSPKDWGIKFCRGP
jgi:hypothetical protein